MSDSEKHETDKTNGRWWEFYFVRYLLGSIVGATLLILLNNKPIGVMSGLLSNCKVDISSIESHTILLWAGLGFAYSYLASAPILVFHATRGVWLKRYFWQYWVGLSIFLIALVVAIVMAIIISILKVNLNTDEIAATCSVLIISALQFLFIYLGEKDDGKPINDFYKKLIKDRNLKLTTREKYIESYRHLREHGNAFFIVVFEFILAFSIWHASTLKHLCILLLVWIIPAAWVWVIGTKMESKIDMFQ